MKVILNKEDLEGDFYDVYDCPIARALKRNNIPFKSVGGTFVRGLDNLLYEIIDPEKMLNNIKNKTEGAIVEIEEGLKTAKETD
jgi:hypothetical protein